MTKPPVSKDDILDALRAALDPPPPPASEGWQNIRGLMEALGASEAAVRRKLRKLGDRVERRAHGGLMYYRLKNGKPG